MKILVIIGSPRKGNTYHTVQKIEQYHRRITDCEYEYLFLKDINFNLCKGCFVCISKGEEHCPLIDDRDLIIQKIDSADGVILASPNYAANVPWLMKNCIDRFAYTCHRPRYFNQKFMLLVTSGSYMGIKDVLKALSIMVSGGSIISRLSVFNSPGMNPNKQKLQDNKIKKATEKFAKILITKKDSKPPFSYLIWFSVFKASSVINQEGLPADFYFYKNKNYFIECDLNIFQKTSIKVFTQFFRFMINKGFV
ncbi:MAG TPA: flavodoxin family protein [Desulfosporosinus sp.]|nr:flavodoxin family protein [Desulfosporosinus sp.]